MSGSGTSRKSLSKTVSSTQKSERSRLRLQDKELQEISDGGWCLSMHQPWASLLVKGIKRYRILEDPTFVSKIQLSLKCKHFPQL